MAALAQAPGRALVLIGFMGAGKSTVAAELAAALGVDALDSDTLLEERLGRPIAQAFEMDGEPSFRAAEEELVGELLRDAGPGSVIALGGGSVCSEAVRRALEPHLTVLLDVDPALAWARVQEQGGGGQRPSPAIGTRSARFQSDAGRSMRGWRTRLCPHSPAARPRGCWTPCARCRWRRPGPACCGRARARVTTRC